MTSRKEWQEDKAVIYVTKDTKKRMDAIGRMNESSDQLINRLINKYLELLKSKEKLTDNALMTIYGPNVLPKKQKVILSDKG